MSSDDGGQDGQTVLLAPATGPYQVPARSTGGPRQVHPRTTGSARQLEPDRRLPTRLNLVRMSALLVMGAAGGEDLRERGNRAVRSARRQIKRIARGEASRAGLFVLDLERCRECGDPLRPMMATGKVVC